MSQNQHKANADGLFFMSVILMGLLVFLMMQVVAERDRRRQQLIEHRREMSVVDNAQYQKKAVGNNVFSWLPLRPTIDPAFVVEEHGDRILLVGVLPKKIKDKVALKAVKALYPDKTVEFHKDFAKVKQTSFL